jgi:hypothetical protein
LEKSSGKKENKNINSRWEESFKLILVRKNITILCAPKYSHWFNMVLTLDNCRSHGV